MKMEDGFISASLAVRSYDILEDENSRHFQCISQGGTHTTADLGASYVGSTQWRVLDLIQEFGLKTYPTNELEDLLYFEKV